MTTRISVAARNAAVDAIRLLVDGGPAAGTIQLRTGAQPATPATAATGTLLGTWTLEDPAWGAPSVGVSTLDTTPVLTTLAVAAGTAGWWRMMDSTGVAVIDGTAGGTGSGAQMILDNPVIAAGQTLNLTAGTMTQPME